jgi:hypothetical protein
VSAGRKALLVATYVHKDAGLRQLTSPAHDAEALAQVLGDAEIAGFDVTMLVNEPHHVVGEAIADFYADVHRDDLTLLYFTGHGVKDDDGRLYLAMTNTRRDALMFTAISAAQVNDAMDACRSRRKVLVLDCCYSGAFPAGRGSKSDEGVQTLERFQGKGRVVLTASDATQYAFEGDDVQGEGTQSLFTRYLVEAIRTGEADLDEDGDIALDELYSYVHERVVADMPQQRPKKLEDVDGRIVIARNVHWQLPEHLRYGIESPIAAQRLSAVDQLEHLHRVGNDVVRAAVLAQVAVLGQDDSRSVSTRAGALLDQLRGVPAVVPADAVPAVVPADAVPAAVPEVVARRAESTQRQPTPQQPGRRVLTPPPAEEAAAGQHGDARPWDQRRPALPVLLVLLLTGVALVLSRVWVFESYDHYLASSYGYSTLQWVLGVGLPVLVGSALLVARTERPRIVGLAVGLLAGAVIGLIDEAVTSVVRMLDEDLSLDDAGPAWWSSFVGLLLLAACVVLLASRPPLRRAPSIRGDWPAVLGAVLVLAGLAGWISRFAPDAGWVFLYNCQALLLAASCLAVVLLRLDPQQRIAGLAAVTAAGAWVVGTQLHVLGVHDYWTTAGDNAGALASALLMVASCWLSQLASPGARDVAAPAVG